MTVLAPRPETRLCVGASEGARLLDMSRRTFLRLNLRSFKIGRLTRYRLSTIKAFLDRQEELSAKN